MFTFRPRGECLEEKASGNHVARENAEKEYNHTKRNDMNDEEWYAKIGKEEMVTVGDQTFTVVLTPDLE